MTKKYHIVLNNTPKSSIIKLDEANTLSATTLESKDDLGAHDPLP